MFGLCALSKDTSFRILTTGADPHVLNDITNGPNPNCGSSGFPAVPGWDPVTGLGTPNYPKMLKLFLSLP